MRKVFIDLGAGSGDDVQAFYSMDVDHKNWEVFAFECNPERTVGIKRRFPNITVFTAAAGTDDTTANLYLSRSLNSNSLYSNKTGVKKENTKTVDVINLSKWITENFTKDDYILMVMDVEGAEYDLVDALQSSDVLSWIDELYIEFHGQKLTGFDMTRETDMVEMLKEYFNDKVYIYKYHQHEQFLKLNVEGVLRNA